VVGPVVGVLAALQAALALRLLSGESSAAGKLYSYEALRGQLRSRPMRRQPHCALCNGGIDEIDIQRYLPPDCAA
jgi:molybdopterin/thiamine biosynthesis adenylyltransferase